MSTLSIGIAIQEIFKQSALWERVSGRIYPLDVKDDVPFPYVVFQRSVEAAYTKDRYAVYDDVLLNVIVASNNYAESVEIATLVRTVLENYRGEVRGIAINDCRMIDSDEDGVQENYIQGLTFKIKAK